ncbi:protein-tyrosine phosphatase-like protein [Aspergillus pseudodeflectus]|uniref:protein-tyrosine-phosphatase n=1 Tax=Aspergillus pseudodeflectus TaxID=176178 RepID=A0ABR4JV94_9EURO
MAMNKVPGRNIYIGGIFSLKNKAALSRANITHVVSVLRLQPTDDTFLTYQHHHIEVDDVEDENILEHFPAAIGFIQSGLNSGGGVLVHCAMGKSRSATICIAYLLHHQQSAFTPQSALALLRESRPLCEPNPGFMKQLELYHQMGCPTDVTSHPAYSRWLYHREVEESVACGRAPEMNSILFEDEQPQQQVDTAGELTEVKCRRCRRKLALARFVVPHGPQKDAKAAVTSDCAHVFLNPLTWMRPSLFPNSPDASADLASEDAPLSGRLTCPNASCGSNIGKFAWQGMQCSCGDWVVPAIALARARVDISEPVTIRSGPGNLAPGIRLPPSMRPSGVDTSTARPLSERDSTRGSL